MNRNLSIGYSLIQNSSEDLYFSQFLNSEIFKYKGKLYTDFLVRHLKQ